MLACLSVSHSNTFFNSNGQFLTKSLGKTDFNCRYLVGRSCDVTRLLP